MGKPDSRPRGRGRVPNILEEPRLQSSSDSHREHDRGLDSSRSTEVRRHEEGKPNQRVPSTSVRKITVETFNHCEAPETASRSFNQSCHENPQSGDGKLRRRRNREDPIGPSKEYGDAVSRNERHRKKRKQDLPSEVDPEEKQKVFDPGNGGIPRSQSKESRTTTTKEEGNEIRQHQSFNPTGINGHDGGEKMPPPKNLEPRRSDRKDVRRDEKDDRKDSHRGRNSPFVRSRKERQSHQTRKSSTKEYEPVRLCPRNKVEHGTKGLPISSEEGFRDPMVAESLTFIPQPPHSQMSAPPDPFHPPVTTAQLRTLILVGLIGSRTPPLPNIIVSPDVPIHCQKLTFPCPIHSVVVTKHFKEFFAFHRHVPNSFLSYITNTLVATQLHYLSLDQHDPLIGLTPSPIKIELIAGNGVIIDTFDFIRCDRLIRSFLRPDHPFSIRTLYDRSLPLVRLPDDQLDLKSDYLYDSYEKFEDFFHSEADNGLPRAAIKSFSPVSRELLQSFAKDVPLLESLELNKVSAFHQHQLQQGFSGDPLPITSSQSKGAAQNPSVYPFSVSKIPKISSTTTTASSGMNIEELLSAPSTKEKQIIDSSAELRDLLTVPTAKHSITTRSFQSRGGSKVQQICRHGTRQECLSAAIQAYDELKPTNSHLTTPRVCGKIHFRRIMFPHTDLSLGDCSYLDTCRHMASCRFVHYEVDLDVGTEEQKSELLERMEDSTKTTIGTVSSSQLEELPAQWITCDIRKIDFSIFKGRVKIMMADPPWDIHMDLPYGTMTDNEMKSLRLDQVQNEGLLFLWVTGRAMELGRECMQLWGYKRVEEIVWVKTNQLHRVIRTGRTGHWLNHSKEHCLVGIKGDPKLNRHLDTDLIVAEVRETSRKPDEIYRIIERLCPGPYKLELFGRPHNVRNNWITLGNQLDGIRLHDPQLIRRYNEFAIKSNLSLFDSSKDYFEKDPNQYEQSSINQQANTCAIDDDGQSRMNRGTK